MSIPRRLHIDPRLAVAMGTGGAVGCLLAYLALYWGKAVLPASYAGVLWYIVIIPCEPLLVLVKGYTVNGESLPAACGIWALVGMTLGAWRHRRKHRNARPWPAWGKLVAIAVVAAVYIFGLFTAVVMTGLAGVSGCMDMGDVSRETHVWFPKSAVVLNSYSGGLRGSVLLAKLRIDKGDFGEFMKRLKAHDAVSHEDWSGAPDAPMEWWTVGSVRDPIVLRVSRSNSETGKPEQLVLVVDRYRSDRTVDLYVQY